MAEEMDSAEKEIPVEEFLLAFIRETIREKADKPLEQDDANSA